MLRPQDGLVVDDTETYGKGLADHFEAEWKKLGGTVVDGSSHGVPKSGQGDFTSLLTKAKGQNPDVVFYGGVTATGGGLLRKQMVTGRHGRHPVHRRRRHQDGAATARARSSTSPATQGDVNSYMPVAATHDIPNPEKFAAEYKAMFGTDPGAYSASGYACAQVILEALESDGGDREKVRAYVTDPAHTFDTVVGKFTFDAIGDTTQRIISLYKVDPSTKDGNWVSQKELRGG